MSIATYAELQTAVADWLVKTNLTTAIPSFIALAEAQMNRRLRVSRMIVRADAVVSTTDEYSTLPTGFLGARSFELTAPRQVLSFLTPDQMAVVALGAEMGTPAYYSIVGGEFRYYPVPDGDIAAELTFWKTVTPLSDAAPTNWLLASHPDAYLYGALTQSAPYLKHDERIAVWANLFTTALDDITRADAAASFGSRMTPTPSAFVV